MCTNPRRVCLLEPAEPFDRDAPELLDGGSWVFASPDDAYDDLTNPYERPRDIRRSTRSRKTVIKDLVTYFRGRWGGAQSLLQAGHSRGRRGRLVENCVLDHELLGSADTQEPLGNREALSEGSRFGVERTHLERWRALPPVVVSEKRAHIVHRRPGGVDLGRLGAPPPPTPPHH